MLFMSTATSRAGATVCAMRSFALVDDVIQDAVGPSGLLHSTRIDVTSRCSIGSGVWACS